ncbi:hypothetical protein [Parasphingorhabdus sp.]|uniref:hypothetical protein n=1 Tax=Parasphingorhabdus sp. TaxID=2709688 RepID=UPI003001CC19
MKIKTGYETIYLKIAAARKALATSDEQQWTESRRGDWADCLDEIERFLEGTPNSRGFSIVRSLDATAGTGGPTSLTLLEVAEELYSSGIDRFR